MAGLSLLLRAAKKAVDAVDRGPLERLGRKASEQLRAGKLEHWAERGTQQVIEFLGGITAHIEDLLARPVDTYPRQNQGVSPEPRARDEAQPGKDSPRDPSEEKS